MERRDISQSGPERSEARQGQGDPIWGGVVVAGLLAVLLVAGAVLTTPLAAGAGGLLGHWHHRGGSHDPELMQERADFAVDWILGRVDGTDEQREQVKAVVAGVIHEVGGLADQHRTNRAAFVEELGRPSVDRAALESLRKSEMELAESLSRRIVAALADVADVLTPEQRLELIELVERHGGRH